MFTDDPIILNPYFLLESSNAWGQSTYINAAGQWTFRRNEAKKFNTLAEAQEAQKEGLGKLARIEVYRDE